MELTDIQTSQGHAQRINNKNQPNKEQDYPKTQGHQSTNKGSSHSCLLHFCVCFLWQMFVKHEADIQTSQGHEAEKRQTNNTHEKN